MAAGRGDRGWREEEGEGGGEERERGRRRETGGTSWDRPTRRPIASSQPRPTATRPRGLVCLPLQPAAVRAASELGCRARPSTGIGQTVLQRVQARGGAGVLGGDA